jgi:16S rRNA (guanine1207-N2)-methyltransferase
VGDETPASHYFDTTPTTASRPRRVTLTLPDLAVELAADTGVFSADRVDPGTRLLLLEAPRPAAGATDLLDLGCGYGAIAVTLAHRAPGATVWAVDVNERAVERTRENATALGCTNVRAMTPDAVPADVRFDEIWSNPPVRIGKQRLHELLRTWLARLRPDGHAYLVVQKHLGADSLQRWLEGEGWRAHRIVSRAGYRVFDAHRAP